MMGFLVANFHFVSIGVMAVAGLIALYASIKHNIGLQYENKRLTELANNSVADLEFKSKMRHDKAKNPNLSIDELVKQLRDENSPL